ncbi:class I SAM-dependent methyltransferase [Myceligenerans crystallogenes]|uniref:Methyltransferase domain-containing protein n=1 Tax=Myceligenerans crystallogenes TaxID=316335 RepID=A0ABN2NBT1_9MICO
MPHPPLTPMARLRWDLVRRLLPAERSRVLEVGCGQGAVGVRLAERHVYTGVELDEASVGVARERMSQAGLSGRLIHGPVEDLADDEQFDLLCAFEVLEHIEDDTGALKSWLSRVQPGGKVLFSVPAWQSRFGPMDEAVGHFRRYSPDELTTVLHDAGVTDVRTQLYGMPLGYALEAVRNQIARRKAGIREDTVEDRTAKSGRLFQPSDLVGPVVMVGTWPFQQIQRAFPRTGTGLVAWGRVPA